MRLNRQSQKPWHLVEGIRLTWRQRVALLFGRQLFVRFHSADSRLNASCRLGWRITGEPASQWHHSDDRE